jgi:hypothetical protein
MQTTLSAAHGARAVFAGLFAAGRPESAGPRRPFLRLAPVLRWNQRTSKADNVARY